MLGAFERRRLRGLAYTASERCVQRSERKNVALRVAAAEELGDATRPNAARINVWRGSLMWRGNMAWSSHKTG